MRLVRLRHVAFVVVLFGAVIATRSGQAVTSTWDGGPTGTGPSWSTAANWVGDALPPVATIYFLTVLRGVAILLRH